MRSCICLELWNGPRPTSRRELAVRMCHAVEPAQYGLDLLMSATDHEQVGSLPVGNAAGIMGSAGAR